MAKTKTARTTARKTAGKNARKSKVTTRRKTVRPRPKTLDTLVAAVKGAEHRNVGGVGLDVGRAGGARVKRMGYPVGFRWSGDMKPIFGTDLCMHAPGGFLAKGGNHVEYADGWV